MSEVLWHWSGAISFTRNAQDIYQVIIILHFLSENINNISMPCYNARGCRHYRLLGTWRLSFSYYYYLATMSWCEKPQTFKIYVPWRNVDRFLYIRNSANWQSTASGGHAMILNSVLFHVPFVLNSGTSWCITLLQTSVSMAHVQCLRK